MEAIRSMTGSAKHSLMLASSVMRSYTQFRPKKFPPVQVSMNGLMGRWALWAEGQAREIPHYNNAYFLVRASKPTEQRFRV